MGGEGSGRYSGWGSKKTVEGRNRVDIRWMKRQGILQPGTAGSLYWSLDEEKPASISYRIEHHRMFFSYRVLHQGAEWEEVELEITLNRTACNYGGFRTWFLCPRCRRRVAILYGAGKYFLCRHCHNLTYSSQQEREHDRLMRKARKIRQKLGDEEGGILDPFPRKPKGMHWKTYWRLRDKAIRSEFGGWAVFESKVGRAKSLIDY